MIDSEADKAAVPSDSTTNLWPPEYGLTKREYFAGLAMQGLMAGKHFEQYDYVVAAKVSVRAADALLAALEGDHE